MVLLKIVKSRGKKNSNRYNAMVCAGVWCGCYMKPSPCDKKEIPRFFWRQKDKKKKKSRSSDELGCIGSYILTTQFGCRSILIRTFFLIQALYRTSHHQLPNREQILVCSGGEANASASCMHNARAEPPFPVNQVS